MIKDETDETNSVTTVYKWAEVCQILDASGNTGGMKRMYDNRIRYRDWIRNIKTRYVSVTDYILQERLHWLPISTLESGRLLFKVQSTKPFEDPDDYKIAWNDRPYGSFEPDVKHLIVWLKTWFRTDSESGSLCSEDRQMIQDFVDKIFLAPMEARGLSRDYLRWFRNGPDLQSIKAVEHFHILVKGAPSDLLRKWTGEPEPIG